MSEVEVDPLLRELTEKKLSFKRNVVSLATELKDARTRLATQEHLCAHEIRTRQVLVSCFHPINQSINQSITSSHLYTYVPDNYLPIHYLPRPPNRRPRPWRSRSPHFKIACSSKINNSTTYPPQPPTRSQSINQLSLSFFLSLVFHQITQSVTVN